MKHRAAAVHVMNGIFEVEKALGMLMSNLIDCKDREMLTEQEFILVTKTVLSTILTLHTELGEAVVKEHPDLTPQCQECCAAIPCDPSLSPGSRDGNHRK